MITPILKCPPRPVEPSRRVLLIQTSWLDRVFHGVAKYAFEHNWTLDCETQWSSELPSAEWRGDGIIVYADKNSLEVIDFVRRTGVPVVDFEAFENHFPGAPKVITSDEAIGKLAAEYLLSLRFESLGYVDYVGHPIEVHRQKAFQEAVKRAGAPVHQLHLETLGSELHALPRPMGLFAANDLNAIKVIRICENEGFRVPDDFAVLGVDDLEPICALASTPLSSINLNFEEKGYRAAQILDQLMRGQQPEQMVVTVPLKGLSIRRSTDTIAVPHPQAAEALRYIRDNFREPIRVSDITERIKGSVRAVQMAFRKYVGLSMIEELTRLRVEYAKGLLSNPQSKLDAIAIESGFSNRFHMIKAFHRVTGKSPHAFRPEREAL